jgi:fluoroquinolone transport system permease protein
MHNLGHLLKGDLKRLIKYKVAIVSLILSSIWVIIIYAAENKLIASNIASLLIFTDIGMMSSLLLCSSFYFEKQEGTLRTTLITPVSTKVIIASKVIASTILGLISTLIVSLATILFHGASINLLLLFIYAILIVVFNAAIAIILSYVSRDFSSLLMNYMLVILILVIPSLLATMGVIKGVGQYFTLLSPSYACQILIDSTFKDTFVMADNALKIWISLGYLVLASASLFILVIPKHFRAYAMEE